MIMKEFRGEWVEEISFSSYEIRNSPKSSVVKKNSFFPFPYSVATALFAKFSGPLSNTWI